MLCIRDDTAIATRSSCSSPRGVDPIALASPHMSLTSRYMVPASGRNKFAFTPGATIFVAKVPMLAKMNATVKTKFATMAFGLPLLKEDVEVSVDKFTKDGKKPDAETESDCQGDMQSDSEASSQSQSAESDLDSGEVTKETVPVVPEPAPEAVPVPPPVPPLVPPPDEKSKFRKPGLIQMKRLPGKSTAKCVLCGLPFPAAALLLECCKTPTSMPYKVHEACIRADLFPSKWIAGSMEVVDKLSADMSSHDKDMVRMLRETEAALNSIQSHHSGASGPAS